MTTRIGTRIVLLVAMFGTIGCDQVTKHLAATSLSGTGERSFLADTVRLQLVENTGGFLSLGAALPPVARTALFTILTGLLLVVAAGAAIRFRWTGLPLLGTALFVSGGASNWLDRAVHGRVTDFINVGVGPVRTGIFNVADVAIMLGVVIFALAGLRHAGRAGRT